MPSFTVYAALKATDPFDDLRNRGSRIGFSLSANNVQAAKGEEVFSLYVRLAARASFEIMDPTGETAVSVHPNLESALQATAMSERAGRPAVVRVVTDYPGGLRKALPLHLYVESAHRYVSGAVTAHPTEDGADTEEDHTGHESGNPHFDGAIRFMGWARNGTQEMNPHDRSADAAAFREYAQTQATLALTYEQHTANLLALLAVTRDGALRGQLNREITCRLGLQDADE